MLVCYGSKAEVACLQCQCPLAPQEPTFQFQHYANDCFAPEADIKACVRVV
jgi:hypothetical protein